MKEEDEEEEKEKKDKTALLKISEKNELLELP